MQRRRTAGFTLIEVMVALVIVALGMMAVNTQLNRYTVAASYVEEKTLASWIATNKLTELIVCGAATSKCLQRVTSASIGSLR